MKVSLIYKLNESKDIKQKKTISKKNKQRLSICRRIIMWIFGKLVGLALPTVKGL